MAKKVATERKGQIWPSLKEYQEKAEEEARLKKWKVVPLFRENAKEMPRIIDVHGHPLTKTGITANMAMSAKLQKYLHNRDVTDEDIMREAPTDEEMVAQLRLFNIAYMHVAWDSETGLAGPKVSNEYVASLRDRFPDVYLAMWGSVDPWKGKQALEEVEKCIKKLKLIGIKFHNPTAQFYVNDRKFYPLWDLCQELRAPVQFHVGYSGMGTGLPGGGGIKLRYDCHPMDIDEVAADFPHLKIIAMHNADPWVEEMIAVHMHKGNVYRETSGIWPKYYDQRSIFEMNRRLQDKFMLGTEYNLFPLDELFGQWEEMELRPGVLEKLYYKNAVNILGEELERCGVYLAEWKE